MGVINQEAGINTYILLHIKEITDKVLLYSTGNYTQYFVITYKGKETETPLAKAVPHLKKTSARHRTLFWGSTFATTSLSHSVPIPLLLPS